MIKKLTFVLAILISLNMNSQNNFEKGYLINNSGNKIECLIKDEDWKNNPNTFTYKLNENSESIEGKMDNVLEFGFNSLKYKRFLVKIDVSPTRTNELGEQREPILKEKTLFLKHLIEGEANLFLYQDENAKLYFYNLNNFNPEQLIYKKYYISTTKIKENAYYKQQLWSSLNCKDITLENIEELNYKSKDFISYFIKYNKCQNPSYTSSFKKEKQKYFFNLYIKPSINFSSLSTENKSSDREKLDFGSNTNFGFGLEVEFILPFNNGKFALVFEPTYQSYSAEVNDYVFISTPTFTKTTAAKIDYAAIDLIIGLKYYININEQSSIFLKTLYNFAAIDMTTDFDFSETGPQDLGINGGSYLAFGVGYKFNNKISIEARLALNQSIISNSLWENNYSRTSLIFGYNLF